MNFTFIIILILVFLSGLGLIISKRLMYNAVFLLMILLLISVIFILAKAEFLAISQIIIYVGGILILILFGIIISQEKKLQKIKILDIIPGFILSSAIFIVLVKLILKYNFQDHINQHSAINSELSSLSNSHVIGVLLMSKYIIALEFVAVLLLISLIGAVILGGRKIFKT